MAEKAERKATQKVTGRRGKSKAVPFFRVANFEKFQHYKERNPPWIKLYNSLLADYDFSCLQDASKAHAILIWLLASQNKNRLPFDSVWIAKAIKANDEVDLDALKDAKFIEIINGDSAPLADCEQDESIPLDSEQSRGEQRTEHNYPGVPPKKKSSSKKKPPTPIRFERQFKSFCKAYPFMDDRRGHSREATARKEWKRLELAEFYGGTAEDVVAAAMNAKTLWVDIEKREPAKILAAKRFLSESEWQAHVDPVDKPNASSKDFKQDAGRFGKKGGKDGKKS